MRTSARETLFKIVFATQFTKSADESFIRALYKSEKLTEDDVKYCASALSIITVHGNNVLRRYSKSRFGKRGSKHRFEIFFGEERVFRQRYSFGNYKGT